MSGRTTDTQNTRLKFARSLNERKQHVEAVHSLQALAGGSDIGSSAGCAGATRSQVQTTMGGTDTTQVKAQRLFSYAAKLRAAEPQRRARPARAPPRGKKTSGTVLQAPQPHAGPLDYKMAIRFILN